MRFRRFLTSLALPRRVRQKTAPYAKYFEKHVDAVRAMYAEEKKTPSGKWSWESRQGDRAVNTYPGRQRESDWKAFHAQADHRKSSSAPAYSRGNPQFCAPRSTAMCSPTRRIEGSGEVLSRGALQCWYAKFLHEHSVGQKA